MRLAIIAPLVTPIREPQRGGSQAFICDLARGLIDRGAEVAVYAASGSELPGVPVVDAGVDSATLSARLYRASGGGRCRFGRGGERLCGRLFGGAKRTGTTSSTTTPSTRRRSASPPSWRPPSSTRSTYRPARRSPPRSAVPQAAARRRRWRLCPPSRQPPGARSSRSTRSFRRTCRPLASRGRGRKRPAPCSPAG